MIIFIEIIEGKGSMFFMMFKFVNYLKDYFEKMPFTRQACVRFDLVF